MVGIDGGGGVDFGGDARREPNNRIRLVFVLGVIAGKVLVDIVVNLENILQDTCGVHSRSSEVLTYYIFELHQHRQLDVEFLTHHPPTAETFPAQLYSRTRSNLADDL